MGERRRPPGPREYVLQLLRLNRLWLCQWKDAETYTTEIDVIHLLVCTQCKCMSFCLDLICSCNLHLA